MAFQVGNSQDDMPMAEINIIPLVDVMLVLLIITMITSPFMEQGVNIDLPVAKGGALKKAVKETPVTLFVSKNRIIRLGEQPVPQDQLAQKLNNFFQNRKTKELFVRADKDVPYGFVAEIIALAQSTGIERVGLVTQEPGS